MLNQSIDQSTKARKQLDILAQPNIRTMAKRSHGDVRGLKGPKLVLAGLPMERSHCLPHSTPNRRATLMKKMPGEGFRRQGSGPSPIGSGRKVGRQRRSLRKADKAQAMISFRAAKPISGGRCP